MGKTIRFNENGLIAIKNRLNEITAGNDDVVSPNDVVTLWHGTTIDALLCIMESGIMSAKIGGQHGETYGVNWFSLASSDNFNKGALFSIEVPGSIFDEEFKMMNKSEAVSRDDELDISRFNLKIEKICGLSREGIKMAYDRHVSNGEKYPLEMVGYLFYHFMEKVQDSDILFPDLLRRNWDKYYPMIMRNILGDGAVNENKHPKELDDNISNEFAPVTEIGAEPNSPMGGTYYHQTQTNESVIKKPNIPQEFINRARELMPNRFSNWVVMNLNDINLMPQYFEKRSKALEYYKWMKMSPRNKAVIVNLDESINFNKNGLSINDDKILDKYNLKDLILSKNGNYVTLNKIVANEFGNGYGSRFMEELTKIADENGWVLALTPDISFGGTSVNRLKNFYKRFGFKPNKGRNTDFNTRESMIRKPNKSKNIIIPENKLGVIKENIEPEVSSSEVDLSSFKKRDTLPPGIWKDEDTLDSKVRLKLLDIADDFWEYVNLSWVEPNGIIITGSICNFNWSKFSDIDLHIIADFREIDEKTEFVKQYLDSKKNEWNNEHEGLKIMGFPVELYVQDVNDDIEAGGIYDLEENKWVRKPNPHSIKSIGLNKFSIKDKAAEIMTIIDDMYGKLSTTTDGHEIDQIGDDAHYLWDKVKDLRKKSLNKNGESGSGNIVYKVLRRTGYLDKLFKLFSTVYDRSNSITESMKKYLTVLKEEVALDGSTEDNPYEKRWKAEREALKSFVANYGKLMQSREDNKGGKLYKVYFDETMSNLIGYNYCICVQWNEQEMKPGSTVYIRALDKFTPFIRRDLQFDTRGRDNMRGTYDDARYNPNNNVTESVNELNLYHASYNNFDKFNHKKYLGSGAGSQTFGWGTYLTDSYPIAKDYAEKFILLKFNEFIVKAEPEKYIENNGSYDEELIKEAAKTYKQIVRFDISMRPEGRWSKNSFDSLLKTDEKASENYDNALKEYEQAIQMAKSWAEDVLKKEFDTESFKANYPKNSILKISKEEYINNINRRNTVYQLVKEMINNIWDDADKHVRKESYIYEVETPDDNGLNYIDLNNEVPNEIIESITNTLSKISRRYGGEWKTMSKWREFLSHYNNAPKGEYMYDELGKLIGVETSIGNYDKAISLFLLQCGIDGFKYKAGTIYGLPDGADENSTNYVIFDANKVRIVSKNLFTDTF